ncbi:MAG: FAD-dependent oxidoreductase [Deltaproteobacteria bacterium]|nr:FAD-dependent oxidoreductase [Deltaproteobacteria bacterium]
MDADALSAQRFSDVSMLAACEQCGCCSSACPVIGVHDFNIRRIVRHIELDLVKEIADSPFPWYCTTCGRCESVCPNGIAILDIIRPLRSLGPDDLAPDSPPCTRACPAGIDIPGYLRLIAQGTPEEACALILEKVPFPGILGRVCMHPCEDACRRGEVFLQPISICALKRYAADHAGEVFERASKAGEGTGHKAAVIGAGPAGLTAAFYLRKKGHDVTVFEEKPKPGGMMRYGLPAYRLPEDVVEQEIDHVLGVGIQLETEKRLGRDFRLEELKKDGFEAIFVATGMQLSLNIDLEGADSDDVLWGIDFLNHVGQGKEMALKERVLVVGGGNVAVDVALTALRLGAGSVTMACLESREEMPASPWEIETALEEGVQLMTSWGPKKILTHDGKVTGAELVQCASVFDEKGDFCPAFNDVTEHLDVDQVILAVGQRADLSFLEDGGKIAVENDRIVTDKETLETGMEGVFSGGDAARGPGAIIDAIASGRKASSAMDRYLGGDGVIDETLAEKPATEDYTGKREKGFSDLKRAEAPALPLEGRHTGFSEVELCFTSDQAMAEARRCLQCDLELALAKPPQPE